MASAQVLSNPVASSKKQEHLQAGKRRLEEFRKKKAAAKKASSTNASEVNLNEKQPLENEHEHEHARVTDTAGAGTSGGHGSIVTEFSSVAINNGNSSFDSIQKSEGLSSNDTRNSPLINDFNSMSYHQPPTYSNNQEFKRFGDLGFGTSLDVNQSHAMKGNDLPDYAEGFGRFPYGTTSDQRIALDSQGSQDFSSGISPGIVDSQFKEETISSKGYASSNSGSSHVSVSKISPQNSIGALFQSELSDANGTKTSSPYEDLIRPTPSRSGFPDSAQKAHSSMNFNDIISLQPGKENTSSSAYSMENGYVHTFGSGSYESNSRSSPNHIPLYPVSNETNSRKSRPSFLDNLNINRVSSGTQVQKGELEKDLFNSKSLSSKNMDESSPFYKPSVNADSFGSFPTLNSLSSPQTYEPMMISVSDSAASSLPNLPVYENGMDTKHDFYSPPKPNEDFAALEQHIEDLTREKFSLQRALETSSVLAESLATENSSLTDSYNQQRVVVDQLKSDMENLQGEIKARLAELEAFRNEYANAQLECNAADERSKLLASEVITLEEKALRLRSNELKLQRQLENSQAEISAYKKKMSSLEKDRMDLQSTIDALQEEKKLLQSKLRKASTSEKSAEITKTATNKKDVSTSTEDIESEDGVTETSGQEIRDASFVGTDASSSAILPVDGYSTVEDSFANIPSHQLRMVHNINTLLSELALEKQELVQALTSESSLSSKLKELNNELSRKLEAQTQRLELLTAQSMANDHVSARQPDSRDTRDNIQYADEGDEVVERVLGWIMKLFPGGPTRRRTSKLL